MMKNALLHCLYLSIYTCSNAVLLKLLLLLLILGFSFFFFLLRVLICWFVVRGKPPSQNQNKIKGIGLDYSCVQPGVVS